MEAKAIDTTNRFLVGVQGELVRIMMPVPSTLSKDSAMILAAYLVSLADPTGSEFKRHLEAIQNA